MELTSSVDLIKRCGLHESPKPFRDASDTAAGDFSTDDGTDSVSLPSHASDNCSASECDTAEFAVTDKGLACVYPVLMLLRMRLACVGHSPCKYGTLRSCEVPSSAMSTSQVPASPHAIPASTGTTTPSSSTAPSPKIKGGRVLPPSSPTSWVLNQRSDSDDLSKTQNDENVARATRSILNKLTVEKFERLYEQLVTCGIESPAHVALLMHEIFEKATAQHHFIGMYADLCVRLEADPRISEAVVAEGENSFRRLLLNQCQRSFEALLRPTDLEISPCSLDPGEMQIRRKQRALGNVKLVGQLLVEGMLSSKVLCQCTEDLLQGHRTCPEALESLAALLKVAGPRFDAAEWQHRPRLEVTIARIKELTCDHTISARERFLLRDILDLRKVGWPGCQVLASGGPMRLEDVRCQATTASPTMRQPCAKSNLPKKPEGKLCSTTVVSAELDAKSKPKRKAEGKRVKTRRREQARLKSASSCNTGQAELLVDTPAQEPPSTEKESQVSSCSGNGQAPSAECPEDQIACRQVSSDSNQSVEVHEKAQEAKMDFSSTDFHHAITATLQSLGARMSISDAVQGLLAHNVPQEHQAREFADILTRAVEERRGRVRRAALKMAAGLVGSGQLGFAAVSCLEGLRVFFMEIFDELCLEVPQLEQIAAKELIPTMCFVFPPEEVMKQMPEHLCSP